MTSIPRGEAKADANRTLRIGDPVRGVGMGTGEVLTTWTAWDGTPKATVRWESGATWDYRVESLTKVDTAANGSKEPRRGA